VNTSVTKQLKELASKLDQWINGKLKAYDSGSPEHRVKRDAKYGDRAGFHKWLCTRAEQQVAAAKEKLELEAAVQAVQIQPTSLSHATIAEPGVNKYMEWLRDNGVQLNPALGFPMYFHGVRGVGTTSVVRKGTPLFKIPLTRAMDTNTALRSDLGHIFRSKSWKGAFGEDLGLDGWLPLILLIAHEKMKIQLFEEKQKRREEMSNRDGSMPIQPSIETRTVQVEKKGRKGKKSGARRERARAKLRRERAQAALPGSTPSYFTPWIKMMPTEYDSMTPSWKDSELDELQSPEAKDAALAAAAKRATTWKKLQAYWTEVDKENGSGEDNGSGGDRGCVPGHMLRHPAFTKELFDWAWSTVDSRVGRLGGGVAEGEGAESTVRLLPFFGMMNHRSTNIDWGSQPRFAFDRCPVPPAPVPEYVAHDARGEKPRQWAMPALVVEAERDYRAGEEVGFLYGAHGDEHLLRTYGFLDLTVDDASDREGNPHNTVELQMPAALAATVRNRIRRIEQFANGSDVGDSEDADDAVRASDVTPSAIARAVEEASQASSTTRSVGNRVSEEDILQGDGGRVHFGVETLGHDGFDFGLPCNPLAYFRLLVATDAELKVAADAAADVGGPRGVYTLLLGGPAVALNDRNERAALEAAAALLRSRLRLCATSLEEDEARLAESGGMCGVRAGEALFGAGVATEAMRAGLALRFRVGQKRLLVSHVAAIEKAVSGM
jgi:hypothetical protein